MSESHKLPSTGLELMTNVEMGRADQLAATKFDVCGQFLMENAGCVVADCAETLIAPADRICVLCGPGNNGGDGFVAARLLLDRGYHVQLALLGDRENLTSDAAAMAPRWRGKTHRCDTSFLQSDAFQASDLLIDGLFGAGLGRAFDQATDAIVAGVNQHRAPVLSIDVPSGVNGSTGYALPNAIVATKTVTFFRLKPGHLLLPGRDLCGQTVVRNIGIPARVLEDIPVAAFVNAPQLWADEFPVLGRPAHKYHRGHSVVVSGGAANTGAARLAARGALRVGSGLVTVASPRSAVLVNAASLTAIMVEGFEPPDGLADVLSDPRCNAILIGPGAGVGAKTRAMVKHVLASPVANVVLDADALTSFEQEPDVLFAMIKARKRQTVLTPHAGEFSRLFPTTQVDDIDASSKLQQARGAAQKSGAVIVLKGADTVIAAPDGKAAINSNAPAWLATAGSGDVLAGFITGLLAQGMPAWKAGAAGVWLHGAAANAFGVGLIAEDLPEILPQVLSANSALLAK
ncbi:MAG: NAD(P)H-hydrate dehydratase [Hyphomicrobiaceae bacterium]